MASWKETYSDWCHAVHSNHEFVSNQDSIAVDTPINEAQRVILGQAIQNLLLTAHKVNFVLCKLMEPFLKDDVLEVNAEYNRLQDKLLGFAKKQNSVEREALGEDEKNGD